MTGQSLLLGNIPRITRNLPVDLRPRACDHLRLAKYSDLIMPESHSADVIIIGGGVVGLSTAMQLAGRGADVVVLERERLGNGSTGRAAGLLGQLRGNAEHTRMLIEGVAIVKELERLAGVEIFIQTGSLRVAETAERAAEINSLVEMGKSIGFEIDHMPIEEVASRMPYMRTDDLIDACYCPTDGHLQPAELAGAYIKIGRQRGVQYKTNTPVTGILVESGRVRGVKTAEGEYHRAGRRQRRGTLVVPQCRTGRNGASNSGDRPLLSDDPARSESSGGSPQRSCAKSRASHLHAAGKRRPDRWYLRCRTRSVRHAKTAGRFRYVADEGGPRFDPSCAAHRGRATPVSRGSMSERR